MASWTPRRPSPGLKRRLFGEANPEECSGFGGEVSAWRSVSTWLMSAAACAAAFVVSWGPAGHPLAPALINTAQIEAFERTPVYASLQTGSARLAPLTLPKVSKQAPVYASLQMASAHSAANNLPVTSFTWTNQSHGPSTKPQRADSQR